MVNGERVASANDNKDENIPEADCCPLKTLNHVRCLLSVVHFKTLNSKNKYNMKRLSIAFVAMALCLTTMAQNWLQMMSRVEEHTIKSEVLGRKLFQDFFCIKLCSTGIL